MARWLLKTEPSTYSFDDLVRDGSTAWDGVANPTALKHIRSMKKNDSVLIYHTGDERAVVGTATVLADARTDPRDQSGKLAVIDLKAGQALKRPVTLGEIKDDPAFAGWDLLRIGRLSVVPTSDAIWKRIEELSKTQAAK